MWLTDLLRKITRGPAVGETFRDYIGCYFYGVQNKAQQHTEYVGAPTSLLQLQAGVEQYLQDYLSTQNNLQSTQVQTVQATLAQLPQRLQSHLGGDMNQPFLTLDGVDLFITQGMRQRRKANGRFVE